jgi:hypothetical protein
LPIFLSGVIKMGKKNFFIFIHILNCLQTILGVFTIINPPTCKGNQ